MRTFVSRVLFWIPLAIIAVINGAIRTLILDRFLTDAPSHQVSSLLLIILIFVYTRFVFEKLGLKSRFDSWKTGLTWLFLTIAFEFGLGFSIGSSLDTMLAQYNLFDAQLWPLVLLSILVVPAITFQLRDNAARKILSR